MCTDIDNQLKKLSGFYQEKLEDAYFSACNILFDASDMNPEELEQLVQSSSLLKEEYFSWPVTEDKTDLFAFFEKVDIYAQQFGVQNTVYPEKRSIQSRPSVHFDVSYQRGA